MPSLALSSSSRSHWFLCLETGFKGKNQPALENDQVRICLRNINPQKSMGIKRLCPKVLRELDGMLAKGFLSFFEGSWNHKKIIRQHRKANVTLILKEDKMRTLKNTGQLISFWQPRKLWSEFYANTFLGTGRRKKLLEKAWPKTCLTSQIALNCEVAEFEDEKTIDGLIYQDF